jgi:hypothetical protein
MLSAIPFMNPTRMGRERKSASAPSLRKLAATQIAPAMNASDTESEAYRLPGGAEQRIRHERQDGGVETHLGAEAGELSIRDADGKRDCGHRQSRGQIVREIFAPVTQQRRQPRCNTAELLQRWAGDQVGAYRKSARYPDTSTRTALMA